MQQLGRYPANPSGLARLAREGQEATSPWWRGKAANCRHANLASPGLSVETLLCRRTAKKAAAWWVFVGVNSEKCEFRHLLTR